MSRPAPPPAAGPLLTSAHTAASCPPVLHLCCSCPGVFEIGGERWVKLVVIGQSFMLHQIRKMVRPGCVCCACPVLHHAMCCNTDGRSAVVQRCTHPLPPPPARSSPAGGHGRLRHARHRARLLPPAGPAHLLRCVPPWLSVDPAEPPSALFITCASAAGRCQRLLMPDLLSTPSALPAGLPTPMAPELGLFLDECYYDAYNKQARRACCRAVSLVPTWRRAAAARGINRQRLTAPPSARPSPLHDPTRSGARCTATWA